MMDNPEIRAIVVEDNPGWQEILREILSDAGLVVDLADTLETAIPLLRATPHRVAIVDLALGTGDVNNQDGLKILTAIRQVDPACVAIMLTGYATVELAVSTLTEYGAYSCLRKASFNRSEFRGLINKALTRAPTVANAEPGMPQNQNIPQAVTVTDNLETIPVIVIEDDAGWRSILSELLTEAGFAVDLCSSYGEAAGRMRRQRYQLAVIDLTLGDVVQSPQRRVEAAVADGFDLLHTAREKRIPAIVVSGVTDIDEIKRAYEQEGIFAYLEKQAFNRQVFMDTVGEAIVSGATGPSELDALTVRELEVLQLLAEGMPNKQIAQELVITNNTVKRHLKSIYAKLDVHTRAAAAAKILRETAD